MWWEIIPSFAIISGIGLLPSLMIRNMHKAAYDTVSNEIAYDTTSSEESMQRQLKFSEM